MPTPAKNLDRLTTEILALKETAERDLAETVLEIGERLIAARAMLDRGAWLAWLDEQMPFTDQAARNYMLVARWADAHPALFQDWKQLGPSKLYAIATLDGAGLRILQRRQWHPIPGKDYEETLHAMSVPELHALVKSLRGDEDAARPIGRVLGSYRQRVRRLAGATDELTARKREIDRDAAEALHGELVAAAGRLERAFRL